jgi:hypothetical protein
MSSSDSIQQFHLRVPTYYGAVKEEVLREFNLPEYGEPETPVLVHSAAGVRVVLGTHKLADWDKPDVQIERRPNGWAIYLNPSGGDPCGCVYFLDDGRSLLLPERGMYAIEVIHRKSEPPEIDVVMGPVPNVVAENTTLESMQASKKLKTCARCRQADEYPGDWYGDLCPTCADRTDGEWVCKSCGRRGSFEAMGGDGPSDPICCGRNCNRIDPDN